VNTVSRTGAGIYSVRFPQLGGVQGGNVQVTAVGQDSVLCKAGGWTTVGHDIDVDVRCFAGATAADSGFVASYDATTAPGNVVVYTRYDPPPTPMVSVPTSFAYSANATSVYQPTHHVTSSLTAISGLRMEHVTAIGAGPEHCSVNTAGIACFDPSGAVVDRAFAYVLGLGRVPSSGLSGAFALFDVPWNWVTTITPTSQATSWTGLGPITVQHVGTGQYKATIPGAGPAVSGPTLVQVTAYDVQTPPGIPALCKIRQWFAAASDAVVEVGCYWLKTGALGTAADQGFRVSFIAASAGTGLVRP
jgi:hypothetical protein